jgi:hypothetical protein
MLWIAAEILIVVALVAAPEPPQPDWESLLRDPAADVHWNADGTLWLLPRGMGGTVVEVDPRTGARTERGSATAGIAERSLVNEELRSVRGARQSRIRFSNESAGAVELLWVDTEGDRRSYGTLGPAEVREQHTFAGHAWEVRDASGSTLGYVRGDVLPTVLHIGAAVEKVLVPPGHRQRHRPRNSQPRRRNCPRMQPNLPVPRFGLRASVMSWCLSAWRRRTIQCT